MRCRVTPEYGKTVGWKVIAGRDFSRDHVTDATDAITDSYTYDAFGVTLASTGTTQNV